MVVSPEKQPSANSMAFMMLEEGGERIQVVILPDSWERYWHTLRNALVLMAEAQREIQEKAWMLVTDYLCEREIPL